MDEDEYSIEENAYDNGNGSYASNGEDDILEGDEIYLELETVEEQLESRNLSVMERIRLERHKKFLDRKIEELELSRLQQEEERDNQREIELENMMKDLEISKRQIRVNKLYNRFDETIVRAKRGNNDIVTMMLSILLKFINDDIDLINREDLQNPLQSKATILLEAINSNENLSVNMNQGSQRNIPYYMNQIFSILGIQGLETELRMDTSNDEEIARQLQQQFNGRRQR